MKVLIVISDLCSGGAQKSLVSFLQVLEKYDSKIEVDLLVCSKQGMFLNQIPSVYNILEVPYDIACMNNSPTSKLFRESLCFRGITGKIFRYITLPFMNRKYNKLNNHQILWLQWKRFIREIDVEYDVAMSYIDGYSNYFVIDKVKAKKKILWVHNEYEKLTYNSEFDNEYYSKADIVATISEMCVQSFINKFPKLSESVYKIENISSPTLINKMADEYFPIEYKSNIIKLLSIGRLNSQKGFDIAIDAAKILQDSGLEFTWYIIGDGGEKAELISQIHRNGLEKRVELLGLRENPYPYIKNCDIFVQTSRYEGKSIVLDEAKILYKPIVVTNYTTVKDQVTDGKNGMIVEITPEGISKGIIELNQKIDLQRKFVNELSKGTSGNEQEIIKYINMLNGQNI
ncbi:glycosyltransferase [Gottfriedia sp. NPDC056225]|uniref:glycosyltransferase n=1 Tax=Gottfriedia sp. NPDC056225 TaxID=3345751 RepID=UPI0035DCD949